ncbi:TAXI family TRAP transporter solute-binding subunit [Paraburkholderia kururiensis]|uniref:TAXI family TRAP transporter solute-binding subunit n=1 Tax=Paraburkholderia kururiensis TaxID=984307 RepID=A0ABZ0WHI0_9BURK|nr:TAXI family TRAP transporter solute-binding subunit [Paraburkholderia kururiensis]WQD76791.1 TAXI family TRAP transporter solute-binding subunit [Paraburkholderia kururiensis]
MKLRSGRKRPRLVARFVAISWRDLAVSFGPILLVSAAAIWIAVRLIQPAPPDTLTISAGPVGSSFWTSAQKYKTILARNGIKLNVLASEGSADNLKRLTDPASHVDVAFVQDGIAGNAGSANVPEGASGAASATSAASTTSASSASSASSTTGTAGTNGNNAPEGLNSLGSVAYVPLAIFYHGPTVARLSQFKGERIAIGAEGSGTRQLALALLKANGIEPNGPTKLLPLSGEEAAQALVAGKIDAAFLAGDSAQPPVMGRLYRTPGVQFFDFAQADAYTRRFPYLTRVDIPAGAFDLGKNLPATTVHLLAPTVELVARDSLHPALSDLLIEAAKEVHGKASIMQRAGEFPAPRAQDFPVSDDAARYYKSGKSFLYRTLPFWLASLADRLIVLLVPIIVVLIPGLRLVPSLYAWRVRSRIYRWYGALIAIERGAMNENSTHERRKLLDRLDAIEESVNAMKMPLAYADQFYVLREHIGFVRSRLAHERGMAANDEAEEAGEANEATTSGEAAEADARDTAADADDSDERDDSTRGSNQAQPPSEHDGHKHAGT